MEQRRHKRWLKSYPILLFQDDHVLEGTTCDISPNGMSVTLSVNPIIKKEYPVSITLPIGRQELSGELLWSKPSLPGHYQAGIQLISVPSDYLNFTATLKYDIH